MYAVVGQVSIDIARIDEAETQLNETPMPPNSPVTMVSSHLARVAATA